MCNIAHVRQTIVVYTFLKIYLFAIYLTYFNNSIFFKQFNQVVVILLYETNLKNNSSISHIMCV